MMRASLLNELQELHKEGKTLLISSHVLPEVKEICQRVGVLDRSELIYDGRLGDLTKKVTAMLEYIVRSSNDKQLAKALRDRGVKVTTEKPAGLKVVGANETTLWKTVSTTANEFGITVTEFKAVERSLEEALVQLIHDVRDQKSPQA
jgi:ABC-2 type transport system ATP-binding protein